MSKKSVTVELYAQEGAKHYNGRCVGLLDDREFNALLKNVDLQRKLTTVRTVPLSDIAETKQVQDLRIAIITTNNETIDKKVLFITEPIEMISQITLPDDMTIVGTNGAYTMLKEKV